MFGIRYFAERFFAPRYFPPGGGVAAVTAEFICIKDVSIATPVATASITTPFAAAPKGLDSATSEAFLHIMYAEATLKAPGLCQGL